ncbi:hypothetical protein [Neisseria lactamica]|uniref:hypothetical protein n=1 Tax=Neisseria lactamica TaxID=486 RepID=UPI001865202E|nr:hypothetical protein [Neisseria lactamica]
MPSEPSDGIFDALAVYRRRTGVEIPEPSFSRRRESEHVRTETKIPSFPRKWESRT